MVTAQLFHKRNTLARNHARTMRHQPTEWEKRFWSRVRDRRLGGYKFKRQMLIGPFIVDFVCIERKMVVELDGGQHTDNKDYDDNRDAFLKSKGFRVIRVCMWWSFVWAVIGTSTCVLPARSTAR